MWTFEPHVATQVYREMLAEAEITPIMNERLDRASGVKKDGPRIVSITTESGRTFAGRMFIDATYEGDLMAAAGVAYHVGREANDVYGETLNGVQPKLNVKNHRFTQPVDPYVKPGDPASGLLPGIQVEKPAARRQRATSCVQAYCYRLCTTDVPENRRPWPKPADYDESRYELLLRNFEAGDHRVAVESAVDAQPQDRHEQQPSRSRPTTSAATTTIPTPTTPSARRSSPTTAPISRA